MESSIVGVEVAALKERVRSTEERLKGTHESVGVLRAKEGIHDTELAVISAQVMDLADDVKEVKEQLRWIMRGIWSAAATFLMAAVALLSIILAHAG